MSSAAPKFTTKLVNWSPTIALLSQEPKSATNELYSVMKAAEDLHQPIKMLRTRGDKPWMTLEIKHLIQKWQRLHQQLAGLIKRKIAERKKQYNRKKYSTAKHDYWKEVKSLEDPSNRQRPELHLPPSLEWQPTAGLEPIPSSPTLQ